MYFFAGISLLLMGNAAHKRATQISSITGYSLASGAALIITIGIMIIALSAIGLIGAYKNRPNVLRVFIGSLVVVLLLQFIAVIGAFTLRNKAEDQLRTNLIHSLKNYNELHTNVMAEWNYAQQTWSCCGVDKSADWIVYGALLKPPDSCCYYNNCTIALKNDTTYFNDGCYESARYLFSRYSKSLGGVSLFFLFIEIAGLALAIFLLRDLKNVYGSI